MLEILDLIESYSGILCLLALVVLCGLVASSGSKLVKEIKFLYRRQEILDVNDSLRHVPRNLDADFFHKPKE